MNIHLKRIAVALFVLAAAGLLYLRDRRELRRELAPAVRLDAPVARQLPGPSPVPQLRAREENRPGAPIRVERQRLEGLVLDEEGRPADQAVVTVKGDELITTRTDRGGSFAVDGIASRTYQVRARKDGAAAGPLEVRVTASSEPVVLHLRAGGTLRVEVLAAGDRKPIEDATVEVQDLAGGAVRTRRDGTVEIRGLSAGAFQVEISAPGYATVRQNSLLDAHRSARMVVYLQRGAAVEGQVLDDASKPIAGAMVRLVGSVDLPGLSDALPQEETRDDGRFRIAAVPRGTFRLAVSHPRFLPGSSAPFAVDGVHSHAVAVIVLHPGRVISGHVRTRDSQPARGVRVDAVNLQQGYREGVHRRALTGDDGEFELAGLPAGVARVAARGTDASVSGKDVDLAGADVHGLELVLDVDGELSGLVVDSAGAPLAGVQVAAVPESRARRAAADLPNGNYASDLTDGRGRFQLRGLAEGEYRVRGSRSQGAQSPSFWMREGVVGRAGDTDVRLVLDEDGGVRGRVKTPDGKAPASFSVSLALSPPKAFTGEGDFTVEDVPAGTQILRVEAPGFAPKIVDAVEVAAGKTTDVGVVELEAGRTLRGQVQRADGSPVAGATVFAGPQVLQDAEAMSSKFHTQSDEQGQFVLGGIGDGPLMVAASHPDEGRSATTSVPDGAAPQPVTLVLQAVAGLEGRVTSHGAPIANAIVVAFQASASNGRVIASSREDGTYRFDQLPPGQWQVQASLRPTSTSQVLQVDSVTVAGDRATHLDLDIAHGDGSVITKVLEADGSPLSNGQIYLSTGAIAAATGAELEMALAARGPGQTHVDLLMQGRPVQFTDLAPGSWSLCAIAVRGNLNDPATVQRVQNNPGALPVSCKAIEVSGGAQPTVLQWPKS